MSKSKSGVSNIRIVVDGYAIMIVVLLLLQLARLLFTNTAIELTAVGATLVAWLLLMLGFHKMSPKGAEFKRGRAACLFGILMVVLQAVFIMRDLKAGMDTGTFIDFYVLFCWFMSICALLYTYAKALKGMQPIVEMTDERLGAKYPRTALLVGTIVILTLVFMPIMQMLPKVTGYVGTLILGLVAAVAQGYICKLLLDGYHAVRDNTDDAKRAAAAERPRQRKKEKPRKAPRQKAVPAETKTAEAPVRPKAVPAPAAVPETTTVFDQSFMAEMNKAVAAEPQPEESDFWAASQETAAPVQEAEFTAPAAEETKTADEESDFWI